MSLRQRRDLTGCPEPHPDAVFNAAPHLVPPGVFFKRLLTPGLLSHDQFPNKPVSRLRVMQGTGPFAQGRHLGGGGTAQDPPPKETELMKRIVRTQAKGPSTPLVCSPPPSTWQRGSPQKDRGDPRKASVAATSSPVKGPAGNDGPCSLKSRERWGKELPPYPCQGPAPTPLLFQHAGGGAAGLSSCPSV